MEGNTGNVNRSLVSRNLDSVNNMAGDLFKMLQKSQPLYVDHHDWRSSARSDLRLVVNETAAATLLKFSYDFIVESKQLEERLTVPR